MILKSYIEELLNEPSTRSLDDLVKSRTIGGVLTIPDLEVGNCLYLDETYSFHFNPLGITIPSHGSSGTPFLSVSIGIWQSGGWSPENTQTIRAPISLSHVFTEPGAIRVKGHLLYSYAVVDGKPPFQQYVTYNGEVYQESGSINVVDRKSLLNIAGSASPSVNATTAYSVPSPLPRGVSFNNWTVSPSSATINSPNSPNTTIRFSAAVNYTLTANFTLPGNVPYSITKTVYLATPTAPTVDPSRTTNIRDGQVITYIANNNSEPGIEYQWEVVSGGEQYMDIGNTYMVVARGHQTVSTPLIVRCRANRNGLLSGWTTISLTVQPGPIGPITIDSEPKEEQES